MKLTKKDFTDNIQCLVNSVQTERINKLNEIVEKLEELNQLRLEVDEKTKKWNELKEYIDLFNSQFVQIN